MRTPSDNCVNCRKLTSESVFYFRQVPLIEESKVLEILEVSSENFFLERDFEHSVNRSSVGA